MHFYFDTKTDTTRPSRHWDPEKLTSLVNPNTGDVRCLGWAYTRGRQCQRRLAMHKVSSARQRLDELAYLDPITAANSPELLRTAKIMLCYQHSHDDEWVAERWAARLRKYAAKARHSSSSTDEDEDEGSKKNSSSRYKTESDARDFKSRRTSDSTKKEESPKYEAKTKREDDTERRQRKEQEEKLKREQERKQKEEEEKERERERERKRQEEKEREEKLRERARKRAQEREEAVKKEWANAWTQYCAGWEAIESSKEKTSSIDSIPWPTKSGKCEDVSEASVREFFGRGPPVHLSDTPGEEMFQIISRENKRWHTDKILSRFGQDVLKRGAPCADALNLVAKLIVELRKEAKMRREE